MDLARNLAARQRTRQHNDENTKRAYERGDDAYRVFRKVLASGHPPDDWNQLLAEALAEGRRLQQFAAITVT